MTILCIWPWERFRPSVWKRLQKKKWKRKKRYLMFNFHWEKSSQQSKTARYCQTPMKTKIVSFGSYVWLFLPDFPQTEIACWNSICYQLEQFPRASLGKTCVHWAYFVVNWECCDNTLLQCKTCLHAVYHRPIMGVREGILLRGRKNCPENNKLL